MITVFTVDAEQCAGKSQSLSVGGKDTRLYDAYGRDEEGHDDEHYAKGGEHHCRQQLHPETAPLKAFLPLPVQSAFLHTLSVLFLCIVRV